MLIRIVKLSFAPEHITDFRSIFEETEHQIRSFKGCTHLELLRDMHNKNVFFTYSHWIDEAHLNDYRNSQFFKGVWKRTKKLFNTKPEVYSLTSAILE